MAFSIMISIKDTWYVLSMNEHLLTESNICLCAGTCPDVMNSVKGWNGMSY